MKHFEGFVLWTICEKGWDSPANSERMPSGGRRQLGELLRCDWRMKPWFDPKLHKCKIEPVLLSDDRLFDGH